MDWFKAWFNTPYYHILYNNRTKDEARHFIEKLIQHLQLPTQAKVMDLACGKGRHSVTLNQLGFDVIGLDLSEESIEYAKQFENEFLHFDTHDMREVYKSNTFDAIFNLFTSFGYFENEADNYKVFEVVKQQLKPNGLFIFDYLNAEKVIATLTPYEEKEINGIRFKITKSITSDYFIKKEIEFEADGKDWYFKEFVKILYKKDFEAMIAKAGFQIRENFGNYNLDPFDEQSSDRYILILEHVGN